MSSSVVTPEDVLENLMNDGIIDALRLKIINQLKANEELKNTTISMVEQSKVLNTPGAEKQSKRELFDALRRELETPVLEKASKATWELILDNDNLGKEISEIVEKVYRRLSGIENPLPQTQPSNPESNQEENKEENNQKSNNEPETSNTSSAKKRRLEDINSHDGDGAESLANGSSHVPENGVSTKVETT